MKSTMLILGILLIVLGIGSLTYQGITYTQKEQVIQLGELEITAEQKETIPLPPILGGSAVLLGAILLILGRKK